MIAYNLLAYLIYIMYGCKKKEVKNYAKYFAIIEKSITFALAFAKKWG